MLFRVASVSAFVLRANQVQTLTLIRLSQCVVGAGALPKVPDPSSFRQDNIGARSWLMLTLMLAFLGAHFQSTVAPDFQNLTFLGLRLKLTLQET